MGDYSESQLTIYLKKQKSFISLVNNIQNSLNSKDYRKQDYTFGTYVRKNWNISKAQAYRYIISAKILDQLKEFEILPNYERLCRTISSITKTSDQVRLLWKNVLRKVENRLDEISSSFIIKVWKELCQNEKYNHICHVETDAMKKIDDSINKLSKIKINKNSDSERINNKSSIKIIKKSETGTERINNKSSSSSISSPSYIEINSNINNNISQNSSIDSSSLSIINNNNIINSNLNYSQQLTNSQHLTNSQQLNITSEVLYNPINNYNNNNSQINTIPQTFSYDSLNSNYTSNSSLNEQNNNSQIFYYIPVTVVNSSNNNNYYMINEQTYNQSIIPVTSSNTIYYMVNTPNEQSVINSDEPPQQQSTN